ncbi:MAG: hypothetical protein ACRERX_23575, partial [Pseudomonas sp.]
MRFERFGEGRDGGVDSRFHGEGEQLWIGQAKRYTSASALAGKACCRAREIVKLAPSRYFLVTSCVLTPDNKDALREALSPFAYNSGDIFGRNELDALLAKHPQVLRRNFKLWLNDASQISAELHNGLHQRSRSAMNRILAEAEHFVRHRHVVEAEQRLANQHVCLITGNPGVDKSALAGFMALQQRLFESAYDVHWISDRRIGDALALMQPGSKAVFVLDDFLGAIFLSTDGSLALAQDLFAVINRARRSNGDFKVLLTTRDYILEQALARIEADHAGLAQLCRQAVKMHRLGLRVRGEIVLNQLRAAALSPEWLSAIVEAKDYRHIITHRNFNPRLVQTLVHRLADVRPADIAPWVAEQLDNPLQLWLRPFRALSDEARCVLYVIALANAPVSSSDLRDMFHRLLRALHGRLTPAGGFDAALMEIELNFALSEAHCGTTWYRLSNRGIEDLLQS